MATIRGNKPWSIMVSVFRAPSITARSISNEFEALMPSTVVCTSARLQGDYELDRCHHEVAEQIIRPTGLLDPKMKIAETLLGQIDDIMAENIKKRIEINTNGS
jgi:excinuclease UvrABC helicase subunit UvrB